MLASVNVELTGGLGSQLFGWAAGYSLSEKLKCGLVLNTSGLVQRGYQLNEFIFPKPFEITGVRDNPKNRGIWKIFKKNSPNIFMEKSFEFDSRFNSIQRPVILQGYFQSWKYFKNISRTEIQKINLIDEANQVTRNLEKFSIQHEFVAIHVRRGDYVEKEQYHGTMPRTYYMKALEKIGELRRKQLVIFSDEIKEAEKLLSLDAVYIGKEHLDSPATTLKMMSKAEALIGANSTFSLWAGFLMDQSKLKIFPKKWFAHEKFSTKDLMPTDFIRVD